MFIHSEQIKQLEDVEKAIEQQNQTEAKEIATNLDENYSGWQEAAPDCPCTQEEIEKSPEFEGNDYGLETHHPGASSGYRSSEPVEFKSSVNPEAPTLEVGQQCTYDQEGDLITHGEGAGTPDAYSPSEITNIPDHYETDVFTSKHMSTEQYHETWTPNNGNNCQENWGDKPPEEGVKEAPDEDLSEFRWEASLEKDEPESFIESDTEGEFTSFRESEVAEIESFTEASSESFESFSESNAEMASETSSELASEMA
jgi:hypothetical protein